MLHGSVRRLTSVHWQLTEQDRDVTFAFATEVWNGSLTGEHTVTLFRAALLSVISLRSIHVVSSTR